VVQLKIALQQNYKRTYKSNTTTPLRQKALRWGPRLEVSTPFYMDLLIAGDVTPTYTRRAPHFPEVVDLST
jgi:hypothetical protein